VCAAFAQSASAPAGGRVRARGQRFDPNGLTMAHKTLPFGTRVKVNNTKNKRNVVVRVNDRGPSQPDRIGDVSQVAAARLGMLRSGLIDARLEVVGAVPARKKP
jgi:rare lipoprotein A